MLNCVQTIRGRTSVFPPAGTLTQRAAPGPPPGSALRGPRRTANDPPCLFHRLIDSPDTFEKCPI